MKRQRGRGRKVGNPANRSMESNGPEVKIRGNATQIYEKYMQYARDAQTSGDRVRAENLFQHAEHYYRLMAANMPKERPPVSDDNDTSSQNDRSQNNGASSVDDDDNDGLKVVDASDADTSDTARSSRDDDASGDQEQAGEDAPRTRRRRTTRRKPPAAAAAEETKSDTEARSALDALAKEQAAIAQD